MSQGILGFKYEEEKHDTGVTGLAGLPVYLDLMQAMGLPELIGRHLRVKERGWTDAEVVASLILLNLAGGDCVEDLSRVEKDAGFCRILRRVSHWGKSRRDRRERERSWRKESKRSVPSPSSAFRYLSVFHDGEQEEKRVEGKAFIPVPNEHLRGLAQVNQGVSAFMQKRAPQKTATLDQDATLVATAKADALFSYKGFKSYQPLNTWWSEQQVVLRTEFRDGNVPAGYEQLRVLKEALAMLPAGVEKVLVRSDTAGYQHDVMRYCEKGEDKRFGRIEFAIGAEVCFVPNKIGHSKHGPVYRYLAIREPMGSMDLPGMSVPQQAFPFPTVQMDLQRYKLFGLVTNMDWEGEKLIHWHRERCGKSEEAHSVMKGDFAGGKLPSGDFGENAAWWWVMILAMNLNTIMKREVLGGSWSTRRMKAIRFSFINVPGRIVERSRELIIRLAKGHPALELYLEARRRIMGMIPAPG